MDAPGSCCLIFYKVDAKLWKEPFLNILAALAQGSKFTHCEISIGCDSQHGMKDVLRVFNDERGVELCARTGRSPNLIYVQLGCSAEQERRMLQFARQQVGKPFSQSAMFRSLIMPRRTTCQNFFCAELVAECLKKGGLIDSSSNSGCATPANLYALFSSRAACTGNPHTLRQAETARNLTINSVIDQRSSSLWTQSHRGGYAPVQSSCSSGLKVLHAGSVPVDDRLALGLTLNSLISKPTSRK